MSIKDSLNGSSILKGNPKKKSLSSKKNKVTISKFEFNKGYFFMCLIKNPKKYFNT